jgi:putative acetyltransferase
MEFDILRLSGNDYHDILAVWESSVRASHHFLSESDIQFYKPLILAEYLPTLDLYGIRHTLGGLAGFIGISGCKIEMLFVHPDDFRKGSGKVLCRFATEELGVSEVDVNEANHQALIFYGKLGFLVADRSEVDPSGNPFPILHLKKS